MRIAMLDFDGTIVCYKVEGNGKKWDCETSSWGYLINYIISRLSEKEYELFQSQLKKTKEYGQKLSLQGLTEEEYRKWAKNDASLFTGININILKQNLNIDLTYTDGFFDFVKWLKSNSFDVGVVSAGIKFFIDKANQDLKEQIGYNFDFILANELLIQNNCFTGNVIINVLPYEQKINNIKKTLNFYQNKNSNKKLYIGDGFEFKLTPLLLKLGFLVGFIIPDGKKKLQSEGNVFYGKNFVELKQNLEQKLKTNN
jgi:phosphoserine phosphatase